MTPSALLCEWIERQTRGAARAWFSAALEQLSAPDTPERTVNIAVSLATRRLGKADLDLNNDDLARADKARTKWDPSQWSLDQSGRVALLLACDGGDIEALDSRLTQLLRTADIGELVAFYQALPLYPVQQRHAARAAEGVRSNMRAVFEAVAHRNPYPSECFDEGAWNQMVLKALFVGTTLWPIVDLDSRANDALTQMLCDYAEERWSASRTISPELWRCVALAADERAIACLERALKSDDVPSREGARFAMTAANDDRFSNLLNQYPGTAQLAGTPGWQALIR